MIYTQVHAHKRGPVFVKNGIVTLAVVVGLMALGLASPAFAGGGGPQPDLVFPLNDATYQQTSNPGAQLKLYTVSQDGNFDVPAGSVIQSSSYQLTGTAICSGGATTTKLATVNGRDF